MNHSTDNNVDDGDGTDHCASYIPNGTYAVQETTYQSQTSNDTAMNYYSNDFDSNSNNNINEEEEEDDRKPPAKPTPNGSKQTIVDVNHQTNNSQEVDDDDDDDDDDENNHDDEEDDDAVDDDENSNSSSSKEDTPVKAEDGRPLSEYEILRLERMKRNREYLSQLGLETNNIKSDQSKKQKPVRPKKEVVVIRRSSISRRTKMQPIRYVEPKSIRDLLETANVGTRRKSTNDKDQTKNGIASTTETTSTNPALVTSSSSPSSSQPTDVAMVSPTRELSSKAICNKLGIPYERKNRMQIFIYKEFLRLRSYQRSILQKVERLHRNVEKELKYWSNQNDIYIRKQQKKQQQQLLNQKLLLIQRNYAIMMQQRNQNRINKKEIIQQMDIKMPHIIQAIEKYDQAIAEKEQKYEKDMKRWVTSERIRTVDAVRWYEDELQNTYTKLDSALLQSAPIVDPPVLRRSTRNGEDDNKVETSQTNKAPRGSKVRRNHNDNTNISIQTNITSKSRKKVDTKRKITSIKIPQHELSEDEERDDWFRSIIEQQHPETRKAKNVGGWISPGFSNIIDRSWLQRQVPSHNYTSKNNFDLSSYIPQIGDIVLYYITGHRAFLDRYPDVLGKKRDSRIPLWEKAAELNVEHQKLSDLEKRIERPWWTNEWVEGVENGNLGDYPLICKVTRTHAEFPPDPYNKVIESDNGNNGTVVSFKKPKKFVTGKGTTYMRLAVTLSPLTYLIPPSMENKRGFELIGLYRPPTFTVLTFPSELDPFIIPFAWGYTKSHAINLNQSVSMHNDEQNVKVRVDSFKSLSGLDTMRLDDRREDIKFLLSQDRTEIETVLERQDVLIPLQEAHIVLDVWSRYSKNDTVTAKIDSVDSRKISKFDTLKVIIQDCFMYLLRGTLPLWQNVITTKRSSNLKRHTISAWLLTPTEKEQDNMESYNGFLDRLDEALRVKLELGVQGILSSFADAKDIFFDPITEDVAPLYNCAVPVGMSFSTILQRIRVHLGYKSCYYRSVHALTSDVQSIIDCCLLYNSPNSEIVAAASDVVENAKEILENISRDHFHHFQSIRLNEGDDHPCIVLQPRPWYRNYCRKFGDHIINRDWLDRKLHNLQHSIDTGGGKCTIDAEQVPFQVDDVVIYSRNLHRRFIAGHCSSLEYDQCVLPVIEHSIDLEKNFSTENDDWIQGQVVWTNAAFPKILTKDEKDSFQSSALLQCVGVKFQNCSDVFMLYWRPCFLCVEPCQTRSICAGCGLTTSFVKLRPDTDTGCEEPKPHIGISQDVMQSILRYLWLLKRQCLNGMEFDKIDLTEIEATLKAGYKSPTPKIGKGSLPSYANILGTLSLPKSVTTGDSPYGTRRINLKAKEDDEAVAALVYAGFTPRWIIPARGGTIDNDLLRTLETILPLTKLSLEYVSIKLQGGFYRHTAALETDLIEAYVATVISHTFQVVTRKKSPITLRRLAYLVSFSKSYRPCLGMNFEERAFVADIHRIRSLYGASLLALLDIKRAQRVFGLSNSMPPKRDEYVMNEKDKSIFEARQKLGFLVATLRNENSTVVSAKKLPRIALTIKYTASKSNLMPLQAKIGDLFVKVKIVRSGRNFKVFRSDDSSCRIRNVALKGLSFEPGDYEHNDSLVQFLFPQDGRTGTCARCQAFNQSMASCRILYKHSNLEFDWSTVFKDGISFVDNLIKYLDPDTSNVEVEYRPSNNSLVLENTTMNHETLPTQNTLVESIEDCDRDPSEFLRSATNMATIMSEVLDAAKSFSAQPLRLSKEFIATSFPIDNSDGHYLYCIVCGLTGDVLCCDGCPNVVHRKCISLTTLPEGDWFCEECLLKKSTNVLSPSLKSDEARIHSCSIVGQNSSQPKHEDAPVTTPDLKPQSTTICQYDVYGRVNFDETEIDRIFSELETLRNARQAYKPKNASSAESTNESGDGIEGVLTSNVEKVNDVAGDSESANENSNECVKTSTIEENKSCTSLNKNGTPKRNRKLVELHSNTPIDECLMYPKKLRRTPTVIRNNTGINGSKVIDCEVELSRCHGTTLQSRTVKKQTFSDTFKGHEVKEGFVGSNESSIVSTTIKSTGANPIRQSKRQRISTSRFQDLPRK